MQCEHNVSNLQQAATISGLTKKTKNQISLLAISTLKKKKQTKENSLP